MRRRQGVARAEIVKTVYGEVVKDPRQCGPRKCPGICGYCLEQWILDEKWIPDEKSHEPNIKVEEKN